MEPKNVFQIERFPVWLASRFLSNMGKQMMALIIAWQVYEISKAPLALGLVGLSEALPYMLLALWAGHFIDRTSRRAVLIWSKAGFFFCSLILLGMTYFGVPRLWLIFLELAIFGAMESFETVAASAYIQTLSPKKLFPRVAAWNLSLFMTAMIVGPVLAGWFIKVSGPLLAYSVASGFFFCSVLMSMQLKKVEVLPAPMGDHNDPALVRIKEGLKFIKSKPLMFASMSLDMFAVLFGGVVALFPIFADKMGVGPVGLGMLRASPAIGSLAMALLQALHLPIKPSWKLLVWSVVIFGICILGFGISTNFYLSLFLMVVSGSVDSLSVITRSTIMQVLTPDHLRGRVSSVGGIFIRTSNEIGAFESGLAAKLIGTVPSVIFGGSMTLVIAGLWAYWFRKMDTSALDNAQS